MSSSKNDSKSMPISQQSDVATQGLNIYIVGGAVRDALLGQQVGDRDWVVVGASPDHMIERGFIPVGGDFPVFLHPKTKEEYALARTERKSGRGYKGFTFYTGPDVTLEDDLSRRDLTINAIARDANGELTDPFNGVRDIHNKVLRHVGEAFTEDPVRLLRLARFAARFPNFNIAPETFKLACRLVNEGEVDALVPERVWQEFAKGLMSPQPGRMMTVLEETGALKRVVPSLKFRHESVKELACAATKGLPLESRFALLCRFSQDANLISNDIRAPNNCKDYAKHLPVILKAIQNSATQSIPAQNMLNLMLSCDAVRRPERFMDLIDTASCVQAVEKNIWKVALHAIRSIDAGAIAKAAGTNAEAIKSALYQARLQALQSVASIAITKTN